MRLAEQTSHVTIAARIVSRLSAAAREVGVSDVRIGLGYTAVVLADGRAGVAYTFRDRARGGCSVFNGVRPLSARSAADLLAFLESEDAIEAAVGLACANALVNRDKLTHLYGDILEHLDLRSLDHVGMVGHFGPLVGAIQKRALSLKVFERVDHPSGLLRPQGEATAALSQCQVALITATSVINHTVDNLLEAAQSCREVVLLGASTPLMAEVFDAYKVTMLCGVIVKETDEVLRVVSEGGGMRQFRPYLRKVSVIVGGSKTT